MGFTRTARHPICFFFSFLSNIAICALPECFRLPSFLSHFLSISPESLSLHLFRVSLSISLTHTHTSELGIYLLLPVEYRHLHPPRMFQVAAISSSCRHFFKLPPFLK